MRPSILPRSLLSFPSELPAEAGAWVKFDIIPILYAGEPSPASIDIGIDRLVEAIDNLHDLCITSHRSVRRVISFLSQPVDWTDPDAVCDVRIYVRASEIGDALPEESDARRLLEHLYHMERSHWWLKEI